jgi:GH43 family beta-xylosidase
MKYSFLGLLLLLLGMRGNGQTTPNATLADTATTFTNPLLVVGPDPWVIQKAGWYYYMHTTGNSIVIRKTKAITALKDATAQVVWKPDANGTHSKNIWAPELHYLNKKWYIYYTAGSTKDLATQRTFVLENAAADPTTGSWTDKGQIGDTSANYFAIDGTILTYKGKNYFIWSGHISASDNTQRLYIARMANPWTLATARVEISSPQYDWEKIGTPHVNEGPEILKNAQDEVFLIYSGSGCWTDDYTLGQLRLKRKGDPLVPAHWEKAAQPVFAKSAANSAFGPGHNGFFKSADGKEDWIIFHANPLAGQGCGNARSPRIQPFTWKANGAPDFGTPLPLTIPMKKPSGE